MNGGRFGLFTAPDGGLAGPGRFGPFRQCMPALEKMLTVVLVLLVVLAATALVGAAAAAAAR